MRQFALYALVLLVVAAGSGTGASSAAAAEPLLGPPCHSLALNPIATGRFALGDTKGFESSTLEGDGVAELAFKIAYAQFDVDDIQAVVRWVDAEDDRSCTRAGVRAPRSNGDGHTVLALDIPERYGQHAERGRRSDTEDLAAPQPDAYLESQRYSRYRRIGVHPAVLRYRAH